MLDWEKIVKHRMAFALVLVNVLLNAHVDYLVGGLSIRNVSFKLVNAFFRLSAHVPSWATWNTTPVIKAMTENEFTVTRLRWFKVLMLVNPPAFAINDDAPLGLTRCELLPKG